MATNINGLSAFKLAVSSYSTNLIILWLTDIIKIGLGGLGDRRRQNSFKTA